jgi:hypothetical protein
MEYGKYELKVSQDGNKGKLIEVRIPGHVNNRSGVM